MSIPKGLIIYKAVRHENSFPVDLKYGYYSDKIHPNKSRREHNDCKKFGQKSQRKLVQKLHLIFVGSGQKELNSLRIFSKFRGIKNCSIHVIDESPKRDLTIRVFQTLFKTLKRLKNVKFSNSYLKDSRALKPLMLLPDLESVHLPRFYYSQIPKNLETLLQILKLASKRRCWPKLKSLNIDSLYPEGLTLVREACAPPLESLKSLLEFMKSLKDCENIQKCFNTELILPYISELDCERNIVTLDAISRQMICSLKSLQIAELSSKILENFQHSKNLKRVMFTITEQVKEKVDLSVLKALSSFQELELWMRNDTGIDLILHSDIFTQIQMLSNLTAFAFYISGEQRPIEEFNLNLPGVISSLTNLKSLRLNFERYSDDKIINGAWFEEVFKAVATRTKLKKLKIAMVNFRFENPRRLFGVFCESLKKLEDLSDLTLKFSDRAMTIKEKEIAEFCKCLGNLKNIQDINFSIKCSQFQPKALGKFLSCLANNFPLLSRLTLNLENIKITNQVYQNLEKIVQKQRYLNMMDVFLAGQIGKGFCLSLNPLKNEMLKRFIGDILFILR